MKPQDREYARRKLARSRQTLDEAAWLLKGGFVEGAVNRIYYGCFYAVSALLSSEGHSRSKHSGVMSMFDELWIKPRRLPRDTGAFYHLMFERRHKGDYEDITSPEKTDIENWLDEASKFVDSISEALQDIINNSP